MQIIEVKSPKEAKEFLQMAVRLYQTDNQWIRPLDKDIEEVFDEKKNKLFRNGTACRWLLLDNNGRTIGRVAAFVNGSTAHLKDNRQPTGGMGFFECIDNQEAANLLFDTCKVWLTEKGMEAMDGPINFGDRDRWWGCLVDGFFPPNYGMPYNFPYYRQLFENYGFKQYFQQYTYRCPTTSRPVQKVYEKAERVMRNPDYKFTNLKIKDLDKYAEDFRVIYNKAWAKHSGVREMPKQQAISLFRKMKPVIDEKLVRFGYYKGEPVAFFIMLPELNQIFKHLNGSFDWLAKLKFLWYKYTGACTNIFGVVFGVVPEHQGKGVESAIVIEFSENVVLRPGFQYEFIEMNWIGDFNPKMMKVAEDVGGSIYKTHVTYRKLFDENRPFERAKIIE